MRMRQGVLWWVIQAYDTAVYPNPILIPALIRQAKIPGQAEPWVQPLDQYDAYKLVNPFTSEGDLCTHNGSTWQVTQADGAGNNVWERVYLDGRLSMPYYEVNGYLVDENGVVQVSQNEIASYSGGMPFDSAGRLVVQADVPPQAGDAYVGGIRVGTNGVYLVDDTPPVPQAFSTGFDTGYGA